MIRTLHFDDIPRKSTRIASRVIGGEAVIVVPTAGDVLALNDMGTRIWGEIDGKKSVGDIIQSVVRDYDVTKRRAGRDVRAFLRELQKNRAVVVP